jgi:hypothetical protein
MTKYRKWLAVVPIAAFVTCVGAIIVVPILVLAIIVQLMRRGGRERLTASLSLVVSACVLAMVAVTWMPLRFAPEGAHSVGLALLGVGVVSLGELIPMSRALRRVLGVIGASVGGALVVLLVDDVAVAVPAVSGVVVAAFAGLMAAAAYAIVDRLAEGVAMIAAAFWPKPVIVRLSDFKSNEYRKLLGGERYEPEEENPMLGFRGASRYIDPGFRDCFELECRALRKVRGDMGLTNVQVMVPFVRTVAEAEQVVALLEENGLERGKDGLKVIMMCELPSNALLADEFLEHFDGFSIGSNDLTQLTLGLDRDSGVIAHLFDERDDAVKKLLSMAIQACRARGKYIGICGQGPSDHPDLAAWLLEQGIESVSLNPDTVVETWLHLAGEKA